MKRLIIIGCGGHGSVVADAAKKCGYQEIAFLDDGDKKDCLGYPVVGGVEEANRYLGDAFFVAIGNGAVREKVSRQLQAAGANIVNIIHPSAIVGANVTMGKGILLAAGAIVNPGAVLGDGVIVNTAASVDHDCQIDNYVHVAVGAHLAGNVSLGERTWVGIGASVVQGVCICKDCMVGAGATVVKDITETGTYLGTPAKKLVK